MSSEDLEVRVARLEKTLAAFSAELQLAYHYVTADAASSLTKSRLILEKLVVGVYVTEMAREPRKPLLGEMLSDNQFTRKIERRILSRMNAVRDLGNLGPHGEPVEGSDAARALDDLCEVLDWYLRRYGQPGRPAGADGAATGPATHGRPRRGRRWWVWLLAGAAAVVLLGLAFAAGASPWLGAKASDQQEVDVDGPPVEVPDPDEDPTHLAPAPDAAAHPVNRSTRRGEP